MKSPYPYFGGKSAIMPQIWKRLGDTYNFVDPFFGSNAPLLSRPAWDWGKDAWADGSNRIETINDKDGFVANFWRAISHDPKAVARWADWPINEIDLYARHKWLVNNQEFVENMRDDPDYYDAKVAGWWVWGISQWIGGGWCKELHNRRPHLLRTGKGIHRVANKRQNLSLYFDHLAARLRQVRVCCGDWKRVLGPTPTFLNGKTSIILDPPYGERAERDTRVYNVDSLDIADRARVWAIENGDNPMLRIALFGYEDEHEHLIPDNWERLAWRAHGGYSNQNVNGSANRAKERVWFSPHCLKAERVKQLSFFSEKPS